MTPASVSVQVHEQGGGAIGIDSPPQNSPPPPTVTASAVEASGDPINPAALFWFSDNTLIANVSPDSSNPGQAKVAGTSQGVTNVEVGCVGCSSTAKVEAKVTNGAPAEPPFDIQTVFTGVTGPRGTPGRLVEGPAPVGIGPSPQGYFSGLNNFVPGSTDQEQIVLVGPTTHILIGARGSSNHYDISLPNIAQAGTVPITLQLGAYHPPFFEVFIVSRDPNGFYSEGRAALQPSPPP